MEQVVHVKDRPGHDKRYAIDASKITRELGWEPEENFESGIKKTVEWFAPDNIIGLGGKILGYMFTIGEVGRGSSKTDNPNYPKSVPLKE